ncbi:MAG TPA: hydrogenase/urease maturation nickel metallochaperone HypA [Acidimicrobiales bacterium]|nr:hydrogenase/urease maturation nickel metallochaperone HypA [Acidimicrobiales bacterium]
MHEAGLAASVADVLRQRGLDREGASVRLIVHGGHDDAAAFDDALRLHLGMALPELDQRRLAIRHAPGTAVCVACGEPFEAPSSESPCPACGSPGLLLPTPESIEIEPGPRP